MKIVTWNCGGAFRKKFGRLAELDADLYVVQECEDPSSVLRPTASYQDFTKVHLWNGSNKNKGLGIFARGTQSLDPFELNMLWRGRELKWFVPSILNGSQKVIAVWNHQADSGTFEYIGQFWNLLQQNRDRLQGAILVGDFNSNSIWDHWDRWWNHSDCVEELRNLGIESVYHNRTREDHGREIQATFRLQKNASKGYHIDYVFAPIGMVARTRAFTVEKFGDWIDVSDHVPLLWEYE